MKKKYNKNFEIKQIKPTTEIIKVQNNEGIYYFYINPDDDKNYYALSDLERKLIKINIPKLSLIEYLYQQDYIIKEIMNSENFITSFLQKKILLLKNKAVVLDMQKNIEYMFSDSRNNFTIFDGKFLQKQNAYFISTFYQNCKMQEINPSLEELESNFYISLDDESHYTEKGFHQKYNNKLAIIETSENNKLLINILDDYNRADLIYDYDDALIYTSYTYCSPYCLKSIRLMTELEREAFKIDLLLSKNIQLLSTNRLRKISNPKTYNPNNFENNSKLTIRYYDEKEQSEPEIGKIGIFWNSGDDMPKVRVLQETTDKYVTIDGNFEYGIKYKAISQLNSLYYFLYNKKWKK